MSPINNKEVLARFPPADEADRAALLAWVRGAPLVHGAWRSFKALYKRAEQTREAQILGALIGRLDGSPFSSALEATAGSVLSQEEAFAGDMIVRDGRGYLLSGRWGEGDRLQILDLAEPLHPKTLGSLDQSGARRLDLCGPYACVMTGGYSGRGVLHVFDVTDPAKPVRKGSLAIGAGSVVCAYPYAFVAEPGAGLRVVDVRDPDQPRQVASVAVPSVLAVAVRGGHAYVAAGRSGFRWGNLPTRGSLQVLEISRPEQPRKAASVDLADPRAVAVDGRHAYVSVAGAGSTPAGLQVIDVSDPERPRKAGFCAMPAGTSVTPNGHYVYVTGNDANLYVVDVSDPMNPRLGGRTNLPSPTRVALHGEHGYVSTNYGGLQVLDLSSPAVPVRTGFPPTEETFGYMKRRARRFLRGLARRDPDLYAEVAASALLVSGLGCGDIDLGYQWVSADLLYGGSDRCTQRRHGRGAYVLRNARFRPRTREERAPAAWDGRPDLAQRLYTSPDLPWQTHEAALKMLRAAGGELPAPDAPRIARFLRSPSPLLIGVAARAVAARMEAGGDQDPTVAADAYFLASGRLRRGMRDRLPGYAGTASWSREFAKRLFQRVSANPGGSALSRRQVTAAVLLAREFAGEIAPTERIPLVGMLLAAGQAELTQWALPAIREAPITAVPGWLAALEPAPSKRRLAALAWLSEGLRARSFDLGAAQSLVLAGSAWVREAGWQLLAAGATDSSVLIPLWEGLLAAEQGTPPLRTAMGSAAALATLSRARLDTGLLAQRLRDRPWLVRLLTPDVFAAVAETVPAGVLVTLIAAAPDELWDRLRGAWLDTMRAPERAAAFWKAAIASFEEDAGERLSPRLLDDPQAAATFLRLDDLSFLQTNDPRFGPLLREWTRAHADRFEKDGPLLLTAATHRLPEVREWGLGRVRALGMGLPFALRLIESELPECVALARSFFEAAHPGEDREWEYALALCDSPQPSVRAYGRAYTEERWGTLPHDELLGRLFENPDPEMQAFVAARLLSAPDRPAEVAVFDREVLRARGRGRRAKELVKARQAQAPTVDVATLLAMARSRSPRDAEWALGQLARLAREGQQIEGFSVDGVAGV